MARRNRACVGATQYGVTSSVANNSSNDTTPQGSSSGSSTADVDYFAHHGIVAGPDDDFNSLFNRLAIKESLSKKQRKERRTEVIAAEIDAAYGTDVTKLEKWQELCRDVRIEPIPSSITSCRKALSKIWVNLENLVDHRRNRDIELILFPGYKEFHKYTVGDGGAWNHIFPKKRAKKEGFIKALLRKLNRVH